VSSADPATAGRSATSVVSPEVPMAAHPYPAKRTSQLPLEAPSARHPKRSARASTDATQAGAVLASLIGGSACGVPARRPVNGVLALPSPAPNTPLRGASAWATCADSALGDGPTSAAEASSAHPATTNDESNMANDSPGTRAARAGPGHDRATSIPRLQ
jgi:hypothetical protein